MVERVDAKRFVCGSRWDLENFLSLMENSGRMALEVVEIQEDLGAQGWANLTRAFPLIQGVDYIHAIKEDMLSAKRGDLKTVWDALKPAPNFFFKSNYENDCCWVVHEVVGGGVVINSSTEEEKEEEWNTLEEILDGTTLNWKKKYKQGY